MFRQTIFLLFLGTFCILSTNSSIVKNVTRTKSITTTNSGATYAPGDLIFEEVFDSLDFERWQHEITMSGGGVSFHMHLVKLL